ncbi:MAG: hypothetical protein LAT62_13115 [Natronospirillum sp.]|uniref:hypothetical protein n=1 Tax=Natronospirillum sp. TaxID=2812955 RepID=UPI0025DBCCF4|nr:hypothetical protein [Natronospirillum sp.]MCH8552872.1 hypothetical protein [Natronospirillum sp.]
MTQKKSNDLSDLPRMVPDRDEIVRRRGKSAGTPPGGNGTNGGAPKGPSVWPLYCIVLILASGLGYLGYEFLEAQGKLEQAEAASEDAEARLSELENQLSATDESLTLNESAIQSNFNNITSEIRRLWDVADGRNRDWIQENREQLSGLSGLPERFDTLESQLNTMTAQLDQVFDELEDEVASRRALQDDVQSLLSAQSDLVAAVESLQEREDEVIARLDIVSVRVEGAMELSTDMSQQLNQLDGDLTTLAQQLEQEADTRSSLSDTVSQLRSRINLLEEGGVGEGFEDLISRVDAIDIARTDTIQRLSNIQSQIGELRDQVRALEEQ